MRLIAAKKTAQTSRLFCQVVLILLGASLSVVVPINANAAMCQLDRTSNNDLSQKDLSQQIIRVATFNVSLNRDTPGKLLADLRTDNDTQIENISQIIQIIRPDILLLNEFDFDAAAESATIFREKYLARSKNGNAGIEFPYVFNAPSNTGVQSGFDLNHDDKNGGPADAFGFGAFEGQFGMLLLSRYPIEHANARTFQQFLWQDMPGALLPDNINTNAKGDWYTPDILNVLRLSSKSHWDVPVIIGNKTLHMLASHPTPPVFDGVENRNGRRNHDEIRFWSAYVETSSQHHYIYDDKGKRGGLGTPSQRFVIVGDMNADPHDGESHAGAINQLLNHPAINNSMVPTSQGAVLAGGLQGGVNRSHTGPATQDTADFGDKGKAPGNLRIDYVLPSKHGIDVLCASVFWPPSLQQHFHSENGDAQVTDKSPEHPSDHRLVFMDIQLTN